MNKRLIFISCFFPASSPIPIQSDPDADIQTESRRTELGIESAEAPQNELLEDNSIKMSTEEGESRPSFLVGDQDEAESPTPMNGNQDEDRDLFNQTMSQKPSGFDLAEKRKRLR